ncbi:hypothetical protein LEMLEM_LOCUS17004 [Lemmus lemmus]
MRADFENAAVTNRAPQRTRWYTRLWPACLGHGCFGWKRQQCPLILIEYDPVEHLHQAASVGDVSSMERLINSGKHHVNEYDRKGREEAAAKHPEQTKCTSFIKASRRLKDQVSLREGPAAEQPEQKKKKHVTFNEEVHYNTDMKPFSRLSKNSDIPASPPVDKASTSAIKLLLKCL